MEWVIRISNWQMLNLPKVGKWFSTRNVHKCEWYVSSARNALVETLHGYLFCCDTSSIIWSHDSSSDEEEEWFREVVYRGDRTRSVSLKSGTNSKGLIEKKEKNTPGVDNKRTNCHLRILIHERLKNSINQKFYPSVIRCPSTSIKWAAQVQFHTCGLKYFTD